MGRTPLQIYANGDVAMSGYSYEHATDTVRVLAVVTDGPHNVLGRRVHVDVTVARLREILAFAERCETDPSDRGRTVKAEI